jgi:hypothetical protein
MENKLEQLVISKQEYNYISTLDNQNKLDYLFSIYEAEVKRVINPEDLSGFFQAINETLDQNIEIPEPDNEHRVDVMIDDETIMIEANNLRAIRIVVSRFIESGYILKRDHSMERSFRKDKVTKYLRVFYIVDQITGICFN